MELQKPLVERFGDLRPDVKTVLLPKDLQESEIELPFLGSVDPTLRTEICFLLIEVGLMLVPSSDYHGSGQRGNFAQHRKSPMVGFRPRVAQTFEPVERNAPKSLSAGLRGSEQQTGRVGRGKAQERPEGAPGPPMAGFWRLLWLAYSQPAKPQARVSSENKGRVAGRLLSSQVSYETGLCGLAQTFELMKRTVLP